MVDSQQTTNRKLGVNRGNFLKDNKHKPLLDESDEIETLSGTDLFLINVCPLYFNYHLHIWTQVYPAKPCVEVLRLPDGIKKGLSVCVSVLAYLYLDSKE